MTRTCVLLGGPVRHDARVIKITDTLSRLDLHSPLDLFYLSQGEASDEPAFAPNVTLHALRVPSAKRAKLLRHTLFTREFDFFVPFVQKVAARNGAPYDVVYANDLPLLGPAVALKRAMGSRLIYDSHEIYVETLNQFLPTAAPFPKQLIFNALLRLMQRSGERAERRFARETDAFITVNPSIARYFERKYGVGPVQVVMNCPPLQALVPRPLVDFRAQYGWQSEDTVFIYQGVLNKGRGLELLMHALAQSGEQMKLVIVGEGSLRASLEQLVGNLNLEEKVKFFGRVPQETLLGYTVAADVGINLVENFNLSKKMSSPNKLFEYMHAGLPVLASDTLENRRVFEKYAVGLLTQNTVAGIAENLNKISEVPKANSFREDALKGAKEYCWQNQAHTLTQIFESLTGVSSAAAGA